MGVELFSALRAAVLLLLSAVACTQPLTPSWSTTPTPTPTRTPPSSPPTDILELGKQVFLTRTSPTCASCHMISGLSGNTGGLGPELTRIGIVAVTRRPPLTAEQYLRESIESPQAFILPGFVVVMPSGLKAQMSDREFEALVAYLLGLK